MSHEQQDGSRDQGLSGRLAAFRPSVNWNRASGSGIRTLLRGSKSSTTSTPSATSLHTGYEEHPVAVRESEDTPYLSLSEAEDAETPGSAPLETGHAFPDAGCHLCLGNTPDQVSENELIQFFHGLNIKSFSTPQTINNTNQSETKPAGLIYVTLLSPNEAQRAVLELDGKQLIGQDITVQPASTKSPSFLAYMRGDYLDDRSESQRDTSLRSVPAKDPNQRLEDIATSDTLSQTRPPAIASTDTLGPPSPRLITSITRSIEEMDSDASRIGTKFGQLQNGAPVEDRASTATIKDEAIDSSNNIDEERKVQSHTEMLLRPESVPLPESYEPTTRDHSEDYRAMDGSSVDIDSAKGDGELLSNTAHDAVASPSVKRGNLDQGDLVTRRLHITNIPQETTANDVQQLFDGHSIATVDIVHKHGQSVNEAFIDIRGLSAAENALDKLRGASLNGHSNLNIHLIQDNDSRNLTDTTTSASIKSSGLPVKAGHVVQLTESSEQSSAHHDSASSEEGELFESGEVSSQDLDSSDEPGELEDIRRSEENEVIELSSDDDPMISEYSNTIYHPRSIVSSRIDNEIEVIDPKASTQALGRKPEESNGSITGPQTLAELSSAQLELQVRYFYVAREPTTIPDTDPVCCTVCSAKGHLALWCPAHICTHCNAKGTHFSKECPDFTRCNRCRGRHSITDCKHKLRPLHLTITCDLCQEDGHVELDCELTWRSSGPIWKQPLPPLSVAKTCFICGESGHLGNDCRLRQPGKAMGSSMWSESGLPDPLTPLTTSVDRPVLVPTGSKKNKQKMPNSRAQGNKAAPSKLSGTLKSASFQPVNMTGTKGPATKVKKKAIPGSIQIKGLASRANLESKQYSVPQSSGKYQDYRDNQQSGYYSGPQTRNSLPQDLRYSDQSGGFPRGRSGEGRYRSRSRSRSPRGWYQVPPRSAGYAPSSRDYRDRDEPRYSTADTWRPGGR